MNKTKYFKYTIRFAKEYGVLQELKKAICTIKHLTKEKKEIDAYPYKDSKILIFFERILREKFNIRAGRYFNDYTMFLHKSIGEEKEFELFKSYIILNYGNDVFELFLNNIKIFYLERVAGNEFIQKYMPHLKELADSYNTHIMTNEEKIKIIKQLPATGYIMCTFDWTSTKQGHNFWRGIYYNWIKYYEKNIMLM